MHDSRRTTSSQLARPRTPAPPKLSSPHPETDHPVPRLTETRTRKLWVPLPVRKLKEAWENPKPKGKDKGKGKGKGKGKARWEVLG